MIRTKAFIVVVLTGVMLLVGGCADHVAYANLAKHDVVGFWFGVWHGAILPIAWLNSLLDPDVAIYAVYNDGVGYNTGFMVGVGSLMLAAVSLNTYKYRH